MASFTRARLRVLDFARRLDWLPLFALRLTLFAVFVPTGWGKLHALGKVTRFFTELGIPYPHASAVLVGTTELVCGGLLLVGLFTRLATLPLLVDMVVAIFTAKLPEVAGVTDFLALEEFSYICMLLVLLVAGPGLLSLDGLAGRRLDGTARRPLTTPI